MRLTQTPACMVFCMALSVYDRKSVLSPTVRKGDYGLAGARVISKGPGGKTSIFGLVLYEPSVVY